MCSHSKGTFFSLRISQKNQSNVLGLIRKCALPFYKQTGLKTVKAAKTRSIDFSIQSIYFSVIQTKKSIKLVYEKQLTDFTLKICFQKPLTSF